MSIVRVAKYAGVSTATVSRVLNSVGGVSEATVNSVLAAVEALKYDPREEKRGPKPGQHRVGSSRLCVHEPDSAGASVRNISCSDTSFGDLFIKRTGGSMDLNGSGFQ
jgi:hypothetical protein